MSKTSTPDSGCRKHLEMQQNVIMIMANIPS